VVLSVVVPGSVVVVPGSVVVVPGSVVVVPGSVVVVPGSVVVVPESVWPVVVGVVVVVVVVVSSAVVPLAVLLLVVVAVVLSSSLSQAVRPRARMSVTAEIERMRLLQGDRCGSTRRRAETVPVRPGEDPSMRRRLNDHARGCQL